MPFDIQGARKAGASDDQIIQYLTSTRHFDVSGAVNAGASKQQIIDYLTKTPKPGFAPAPAINSTSESTGGPVASAVNSTADFLGIKKAGQGLATAGRVASGSINQTGNEAGQGLKDTLQLTKQLHQMVLDHVPANDPKRLQLVNFLRQTQGQQPVSQAEIDPGTQLSNKEVLGSFGNVALLATAPGLPSGGSSLAGKVAAGAATGYASDVAQAANNNQKSIFKPGLGTALGAGLPIVTKVGGAILKRVTGLTTGVGKDVIQRAIDNPTEVNAAINQFAKTPEAQHQLVDTAKDALNDYLQHRSQQFGEGVSKMIASEPIDKSVVVNSFATAVGKFGGQIQDGALVFGDTALNSTEQKAVQDVFDTVKGWKNVTPQGMETLRQRITNEMANFKFTGNGRDSVVLGAVKQDLTQLLKDKVPGYADMLSTYGTQTQTAKDLAAELSLKSNNAKPATQLNQIMKLFKKDPIVLDNLTKIMGPQEANKFLNDVSGAILSSWIPKQGLVGKIAEGSAAGATGVAALMHVPGAIPAAATGAAIASPRVVGKTAVLAGKAEQSGLNAGMRRASALFGSKANQQ